jgi:hypothetical protein
LEEMMGKAVAGMAGAMLGSILIMSNAHAAPTMTRTAIKADPGFVTVAAHRRAPPVARQSRSDITSFSSSSAAGGVGVNHPPKK